jgi:SAM-dependent methyltransferase
VWTHWYQYVSGRLGEAPIRFLNHGYAVTEPTAASLPLPAADEPHRLSIQLYHRVAGAVSLEGKRVLEVSSGRGGGAAFCARAFQPALLLAIDRSPKAVAYCGRQYRFPNLRFAVGDAENLLVPAQSFDAVLNVEASHAYGDPEKFLAEAHRVLRPGGCVLLADYRLRTGLPVWERQFQRAGFEIRDREDISHQVVRALELSTEERLELIRRFVPRLLHQLSWHFAGARGSRIFRALHRGEAAYMRFVLAKSEAGE